MEDGASSREAAEGARNLVGVGTGPRGSVGRKDVRDSGGDRLHGDVNPS